MLVVCSPDATPMPPGDVLRVISAFDAAIPLADAMNSYIFSAVFESDGDVANDWQFVPPYDWDLFRDTDRWYQLAWDHLSGGWSTSVIQVSSNQAQTPVSGSTARALIQNDRVEWFISMSELPAMSAATYRPTSFIHDGAFTESARGADVGGSNPTMAPFSVVP